MDVAQCRDLVQLYKSDPESVYNTWFVQNEARLKAFRSIRRGTRDVVDAIKKGEFGNDFKGSPLEFVLTCITEQKQVFCGAAHPFYWKPKLRIPDIYEDQGNKAKFGQFLETALSTGKEDRLLQEIYRLNDCCIKGLGPAVGNILYFLHPTLMPPFNTAILAGFNQLFGEKRKLGCWHAYLDVREAVMELNEKLGPQLSKDLGAISGLLYEIGMGRLITTGTSPALGDEARRRREKLLAKRHEEVSADLSEENAHLRMQLLLVDMGRALGYDVFVAVNDRTRVVNERNLEFLTVPELPALGLPEETARTVSLIDVIWLCKKSRRVACAFEIEKSTSIYSGMLRLADLAASLGSDTWNFFLVVPDSRERDVVRQMARPSLRSLGNVRLRYLRFSDMERHQHAIPTFGDDFTVLFKLARDGNGICMAESR